jgi:arabinofuranan 3-O-arabinosyltransferase
VTRDGTISMRFPPRRISSIKLVVASVFSPSRTPSLPIAVREVRIGGIAPLDASREEPLPCEDTGMSSIDGTPVSLRIDGTASELLVGKELRLSTCDGSPVTLGAGFHNLRVGGALQPDTITMANTRAAAAPEASVSADPKISWTSVADGRLDVHVTAATRPFFLAIGQNYSARWRATIGGSDIGSPILVDGYSAGWYVTRSGTYTIAVRYGPQRGYTVALLTTAFVLAVSCVLLGVVAIRRRRRGRST